jgi:hypothetical protein
MGGVGRYFCVALPFILTVASIIAALIVGLTGVSSNSLYLFSIDVSNLTIDAAQLQSLVNNVSAVISGEKLDQIKDDISNGANEASQDVSDKVNDIVTRSFLQWHDPSLLEDNAKDNTETTQWHDPGLLDDTKDDDTTADQTLKATSDNKDVASSLEGVKIHASDLDLANVYDFTLWGYCQTSQDGKRNCTKAQFDWASHELDLDWLEKLTVVADLNITIPKALNDGLNIYKSLNRWTEIVFIIAIVALALELVVGLFSACSRAVSCVTWLISGFATTAIIATAILLTFTGSVIIAAALGAGKHYGVKANINKKFLAVLWLSVAFAIGAGLFWLFSVCCCKPERRAHGKRSRHSDAEKLLPSGSYAPIGDNHISAYSGYNPGAPQAPQRAGARSDLAYEPYSHSRV